MNDYIKREDVLAIIEEVKKDYPTNSVPDCAAWVALRKVADAVRAHKDEPKTNCQWK